MRKNIINLLNTMVDTKIFGNQEIMALEVGKDVSTPKMCKGQPVLVKVEGITKDNIEEKVDKLLNKEVSLNICIQLTQESGAKLNRASIYSLDEVIMRLTKAMEGFPNDNIAQAKAFLNGYGVGWV